MEKAPPIQFNLQVQNLILYKFLRLSCTFCTNDFPGHRDWEQTMNKTSYIEQMSTLKNLGLKVYLINFKICETSKFFPQMGPGSTRQGVVMWLLHGFLTSVVPCLHGQLLEVCFCIFSLSLGYFCFHPLKINNSFVMRYYLNRVWGNNCLSFQTPVCPRN